MKRLSYALLFAILFGAICFCITYFIGLMADGPLFQGEAESASNFKIFLIALVSFCTLGAFIGFKIGGKPK